MTQTSSDDPKIPPTLLRISTLGPFSIEYRDPHTRAFMPLPKEKWHGKGATPALSLLKLLISQPHRYAPQDWILEQFWPETEVVKAEGRLHDASYFLRSLLHPFTSEQDPFFWYVRHTKTGGGGYRLAQHPLIWIDADAFTWYMAAAALHERMGDDPFPFLEKAYHLGARGTFLVEEVYSQWAQARREELDGAFRLCVHQLGRHCLEKRDFIQAETFVRSYWVNHMTDEDALRLLMNILGEQGRYQEAYDCYRQTKSKREQEREAIDPRTHDLAEYWRTKPLSRPVKPAPQPAPLPSSQPLSLLGYEQVISFLQTFQAVLRPFQSESQSTMSTSGIVRPPFFPNTSIQMGQSLILPGSDTRDIMEKRQDLDLEGKDMDKQRREMVQRGIGLAGAPIWISTVGHQDLIAGVRGVLYPSVPSDKELQDLKQKIILYWQACHNVIISPADLIPHVDIYVREVTALLDRSLLPSIRTRLCTCLGEGMHLIGNCLDAVGQFQRARAYYQTALEAAHEAGDHVLQALVWYHDSFSWLYSNEPDQNERRATDSMLKATHFASLESDRAVQCRIQAGLAEVYSICKEKAACIEALKRADNLGGYGCGDRYYIHGFDQSRLNGFRGICLQQFYERDNPSTDPLLEDARQALKEASSQLNVDRRQRACLMVDMAQIHAREGEVEAACDSARQIMDIARTDTPLQKRLVMVRTLLEPYADVQAVKDLDAEIRVFLLQEQQ